MCRKSIYLIFGELIVDSRMAAKKAKKKDVVAVDHSRINYEPFRRAFYHPTPEIAEMTEEDAENLRLALDGIKIKGVDCPKPVMKWSLCGLPASWWVLYPAFVSSTYIA